MKRYKILAFTYLLICALIIGALTGLYLNTINFVIHLVWHTIPHMIHLSVQWRVPVICMSFSLFIGLAQKYIGPKFQE